MIPRLRRYWLAVMLAAICGSCTAGDGHGEPKDAGRDGSETGSRDARADVPRTDSGSAAVDAATPLGANAGASQNTVIGEDVVLDGSGSTGAAHYQWNFGNGEGWDEPRDDPVARVTYDEPGRYSAVLTVIDAQGNRRTDGTVITVTYPLDFEPTQSSTVAVVPGHRRVAVVSPDSNELSIFQWNDADEFSLLARITTPEDPRTVTPWGAWLVVPCQDAGKLLLARHDGSSETQELDLPRASRPYGAVPLNGSLYVSLQATGELARIERDTDGRLELVERIDAIPDARGVAVLPDDRIGVTRWRSPSQHGEIAAVDPDTGQRESWTLRIDPQSGSDTEIGGVPSYLGQLLVSPNGRQAAIPSTQANIIEGTFRSDRPLTFETTVRGIVSYLDLEAGTEDFDARRQFDDRGLAVAGAYSSRGDFLFLAMRGHRSIERIDVLREAQSGSIQNVGYAPQGLDLSADDRFLFVDAYLSRKLVVYDVTDFRTIPEQIASLSTVSEEPLSPPLLRGKRLFNDSFDRRLSQDAYIACAHCHLEGQSDARVWDFTDRGEGLRNTISLLGRGGTDHGPLHWSANFDEVQDFENDIRNQFQGDGLMSDAQWSAGTRSQPLGDPKAGQSESLDALAAYVASLSETLPSPHRREDGSLTDAARRGKTLFESDALGCTDCHSGPRLTDSGFKPGGQPRLHDVGTLGPGSGNRLGQPLDGLDTPTLHVVWNGAPYLHDGSAATLREVVVEENPDDMHGATSGLSAQEISDLLAYLRSL